MSEPVYHSGGIVPGNLLGSRCPGCGEPWPGVRPFPLWHGECFDRFIESLGVPTVTLSAQDLQTKKAPTN